MRDNNITPIIENAAIQLNYKDGVPTTYYITPNDGYLLHDKLFDTHEFDEETMQETKNIISGYRKSTASCSVNYDFEVNPREFYTVLK